MEINELPAQAVPSFRKVNYGLRPRKQIERKIIIELLQELQNKLHLRIPDYSYIGLGSIYYYDFVLFHKFLNIGSMISLDSEPCMERFEFNKPFDFIAFKPLQTTDFLQSEPFEATRNNIIWFDYDSRLIWYSEVQHRFLQSPYIFDDIDIIARKGRQNDFFIITVDIDVSDKAFYTSSAKQRFIETYRSRLSAKYQNPKNLTQEHYPYVIQDMVMNSIRNNENGKTPKFRKLFAFRYRDSSRMLTIGGIFSANTLTRRSLSNPFFGLNEKEITSIEVPLLTYKEKLHLDQRVEYLSKEVATKSKSEIESLATKQLGFEIDGAELQNYLQYYRYYPQYYEGIL